MELLCLETETVQHKTIQVNNIEPYIHILLDNFVVVVHYTARNMIGVMSYLCGISAKIGIKANCS